MVIQQNNSKRIIQKMIETKQNLPSNQQQSKKHNPSIQSQIFRSEPLLQCQTQVILKNYNDSFHLIYPAYNDTLILRRKFYGNTIIHVDSLGRYLKQITIKQGNILGSIQMFSDRQVICWHYVHATKAYGLTLWDLTKKSVIKLYFNRKIGQGSQMRIVLFSQTKLICILEKQTNKDKNKLRLQYYQWPISSSQDKPVHILETDCNQLDYDCKLQKLNNSSGICWVQKAPNQQKQYFLLHVYDLRRKQQLQTFKFTYFINEIPQYFSAEVLDVWQPLQGKLYVRYRTELTKRKFIINFQYNKDKQKITKILQQQKTYQCMWWYRQDKYQNLNYRNKMDHVLQFTNGLRYVNRYQVVRNVQIFKQSNKKNYYPKEPQYIKLPMFYVDPEQCENILAIEQGSQQKLNSYGMDKFQTYLPKYNKYMYFEYDLNQRHQNQQQKQKIRVTFRKVNPFRHSINTVLVHMILQMIENCDEALLQYIATLTDYDTSVIKNESRWKEIGK